MLRIQSVTSTKTELVTIQSAYLWCLALLQAKTAKKDSSVGEYLCAADPQYESTVRASEVAGNLISKFELVADSEGENWFKFQNLVNQWKKERGARSSITETVMMPAYQKIIGMGETALPLILAQLRSEGDEPDQWFWALRAITEANPVKPEDQGNFQKMAQAWLRWAEREMYVW